MKTVSVRVRGAQPLRSDMEITSSMGRDLNTYIAGKVVELVHLHIHRAVQDELDNIIKTAKDEAVKQIAVKLLALGIAEAK